MAHNTAIFNQASTTLLSANQAWFGGTATTTIDSAGNLSVAGTLAQTGLATFTNGFLSNASSTITSGLFSMNGGASTTNLTASGTGYFGTASTTNLTVSSLTSNRIPYITTGGAFTDSGNLTFDGSTLALTGAQTISSTLSAGTTTLTNLAVTNTSTSTFTGGLDISGAGINFGTNTRWYQNNQSFLVSSTSAAGNLAIGYQSAGELDQKGGLGSTFIGYQAGRVATSTQYNTGIGFEALESVANGGTSFNGGLNTAIGYKALRANTTGYGHTAIGYEALLSETTGTYNVGIGYQVLRTNTTGFRNTAIGASAMFSNTTGFDNVAVGQLALNLNTTGNSNMAQGLGALEKNTTGSQNAAVGLQALNSSITGSNNTALGYRSLYLNTSATSTVAVGTEAGRGTANYNNQGGVYVGLNAGYSAQTNSDYNTLLGYRAGYGVTTGSNNIWLGTATSSTAIANLTTGSQNILIGNNISLPSATDSGQLNIGNIIFGINNTGTGSTVSSGSIGIGTTSPSTTLGLVGSQYLTGGLGIGILNTVAGTMQTSGNMTVGGTLTVNGLCVAADTRLRRRRKARKGEEDDADDEGYIYDEVMIKDIEEGDEVATLDQKTGQFTWSRVKGVIETGIKSIVALTTQSGKTIRTTHVHPYLVRTAYPTKAEHKAQKLYRFEVDQSIKVEEFGADTFVALANDERSYVLAIPRKVKRALRDTSRRHNKPQLFKAAVFASAIVEAMKRMDVRIHELVIDIEYKGYEKAITNIIRNDHPAVFVTFNTIGKQSPAHFAAYGAYKNNKKNKKAADAAATLEMLALKTENALRATFPTSPLASGLGPVGPQALSDKRRIRDQDEFVKKGKWTPAAELKIGQEIAVAYGNTPVWERVVKIEEQQPESVYDVEIEGTHNFIGNDIVAHNTAIFNQASTTLLSANQAWFGGTATSTFDTAGNLSVAGTLAQTGLATFTNGFLSNASSTITSGLFSMNGGASTTNLTASGIGYFGSGRFTDTSGTTTIASGQGFTIGSSQFVLQQGSGNVGIGTASPTSNLQINGSGMSGGSATSNFVNVTGTMPATMTAATWGVFLNIAGAGSSGQTNHAFRVDYTAGYTGASNTSAASFVNRNAGTGNSLAGFSSIGTFPTGNYGLNASAIGDTTGLNIGGMYNAERGNTNIGVIGSATWNKDSATNIGVLGVALNTGTSPIQIGGYFGLHSAGPTFESAALIADNGSQTSPIFLARDNGSSVFSIINGGNVGIGTTSPYAKLSVVGEVVASHFTATTTSTNTFPTLLTTNATSTAFFSTTASSTNLFSNVATIGALNAGTVSLSSTLSAGTTTLTNLSVTNISTSTFAGGLTIGTSQLVVQQSTGNVGIGTSTPRTALEIYNDRTGVADLPGSVSGRAIALMLVSDASVASSRPGIVQYGLRTAGGIAYDISSAFIGSAESNVVRAATMGVYGAVGASSHTVNYLYLDARSTAAFDSATLKIDNNNSVGIGLASTNRPQSTLDVEGSVAIGSYGGVSAAPTNGLIVSGVVGIGTASPGVRLAQGLDVAASASYGGAALSTWSAGSSDHASILDFNRSKSSTVGTHAIVASGDSAGQINFRASDGVQFLNVAVIKAFADGTPGTNDMPGRLVFSTTPDGSATVSERMRIDSSGNVGIGTTSPYAKLSVVGEVVASHFTATTTSTNTFPTLLTTNATSTSLFSTTASSTNLFSNAATIGSLAGGTLAVTGQTTLATSLSGLLQGASGVVSAITGTAGQFPYYNGTNTLLATSSIFLATSGNVGIGTTTPNQLLTIYSATTPSLNFSSAANGQWTAGIDTADGYKFKIASSTAVGTNTRLTIDGNGNVGIGTTSPEYLVAGSYASTARALNIVNTGGLASVGVQGSSQGTVNLAHTGASTDQKLVQFGTNAGKAYIRGLNDAASAITYTFLQMDLSNGNVGIGTTTPYSKLSVWGANTTSGVRAFEVINSASTTSFAVDNAGNGYVATGFGVATTSPSTTFGVVGHCVTGDTRLRRRRRRRAWNSELGTWIDAYEYDDCRIDKIKAGDEVLSLNERTGKMEWQPVVALYDMGEQPIYKLTTESGKKIRTTGTHPYLTKWGWVRAADLRAGDVIAAPKAEILSSLVRSAPDLDALNENSLVGDIKRDAVFADLESVRSRRQIGQGLRESQRALLGGKPAQLLLNALLYVFGQIGKLAFAARRKADRVHEEGNIYTNSNSRSIFSNGIHPFRSASAIASLSDWIYSSLRGILSSISPMSQCAGFVSFETYASSERRSRSLSSTSERTSNSANVSKTNNCGFPSRSTTTPAREPRWSGNTDFGANFVHASRRASGFGSASAAPLRFADFFFAISSYVSSLRSRMSNDAEDIAFERIVSIEYGGVEQVWDIAVSGTHNFVAEGLLAHNTYLTGGLGVGVLNTTNGTLQTSGNATIGGDLAVTGATTLATSLSGLLQGASGVVSAVTGTAGQFPYYNGTNTLLATSTIFLATSGKVGIGTTSPTTNLSVVTTTSGGGIRVDGTGSGISPALQLNLNSTQYATLGTAGTNNAGLTGSATGDVFLKNQQAGALIFGTNATEYMRITSAGNVGIGETAPGSKLSVSGSATIGASYDTTAAPTNGLLVQGNVGIGTTSPATPLHVVSNNTDGVVTFDEYSASLGPAFIARRARGTSASPTAVQSGDVLAGFNARGYGADTMGTANVGVVTFYAAENFTNSAQGTYFVIGTTPTGSVTRSERLRIDNQGNVGIGTTSPMNLLSIGDSSTAQVRADITNSNSGTGAFTEFRVGNGYTVNDGITLDAFGTGWTTSGAFVQDAGLLQARSGLSGGLSIAAVASAPIRFYTAGTADSNERLRIDSAGNVGIGTTTPTTNLSISGVGASNRGTLTIQDSVSSGASSLYNYISFYGHDNARAGFTGMSAGDFYAGSTLSTGNVLFYAGNAEKMRITSAGNVGIGTTSPLRQLDVYKSGDTGIIQARGDAGAALFALAEYDGGSTNSARLNLGRGRGTSQVNPLTNWYFAMQSSDSDKLKIGYRSTEGWGDAGDGDLMTITTGGNVGIGTTTPTSALHVTTANSIVARFQSTSGIGPYISLQNSTAAQIGAFGSYSAISGSGTDMTPTLFSETGLGLNFTVNGDTTRAMVLNSSGNLGIGTTTPYSKLSVWGANTTSGVRAFEVINSASTTSFSVDNAGNGYLAGNFGVATTSPSTTFGVVGHCVTGDTRLRRRRRRRRLADGSWLLDGEPIPNGQSLTAEFDYVYDYPQIVELTEGDEIQSLDEETGELVWSRVKALMFMGVKQTYRIVTEDGRQIRTTAEHPYLVKNAKGKWLKHRSAMRQLAVSNWPLAKSQEPNALREAQYAGWATVANLREGDEIAVTGSVGFGTMVDAGNPDEVRLDDKLRAPVADLKSMRSLGIVMQSLSEGERIGGLRIVFELFDYALTHFARKAAEVFLRAAGVEKAHAYRLMPSFASMSSLEMNLPSLMSRFASRASFFNAARYAGLNVSMSSTVSSISNASALEILQPDASAAAMSVSSFARSQAGSFGFASAWRKFEGTHSIFNSLSRFVSSFTSASPTTAFGRDESITSGRETIVRVENVFSVIGRHDTNVRHISSNGPDMKEGFTWAKIKSIEPVAEEDVYDIEVEGTHNFVAGHYIDQRTNTALTPELEELVVLRQQLANGRWPLDNTQNEINRKRLAALRAVARLAGEHAAYARDIQALRTLSEERNIWNDKPASPSDAFGLAQHSGRAEQRPSGLQAVHNDSARVGERDIDDSYTRSGSRVSRSSQLPTAQSQLTFLNETIARAFDNALEAVLQKLTANSQLPSESDIAFGGIVAHNTYLTGGLGVGALNTTAGTINLAGTSGTSTIASGQGFTIGSSQFVLQQGSGRVGIGTAGPGTELDIKKTTAGADVRLRVDHTDNTNAGSHSTIQLRTGGVSGGDPRIMFDVNAANLWAIGSDNSDSDKFKFSYGTTGALGAGDLITIDTAGKVGIGTTTPYSRLSVWGNGTNPIFEAVDNASSTKMVILNSGNVGIGTTNPSVPLEVVGSTAGALLELQNTLTTGYSGAEMQKSGGTFGAFFGYQESTNHMRFNVAASGYHAFFINSAEKVRIDTAGNVGIGTTSPQGELNVVTTSTTNARRGISSYQYSGSIHGALVSMVKARGTASAPTTVANGDYLGGLDFVGYGTAFTGRATIQGLVNGTVSSDSVPTDLLFLTGSTAATERMRITSGGNVGIGTTTPYSKLSVWGANTTSGVRAFEVINSASTTSFAVDNAGNATVGGDLTLQSTSGQTFYFLNTNGSIAAGDRIGSMQFKLSSAGNPYASVDGHYTSANNGELRFRTMNTGAVSEAMRITSTGKIGIGTTSPDTILHLSGTGPDITFEDFNPGGTKWMIMTREDAVGDFKIRDVTNGADRLYINSSGNIGLGNILPLSKLGITGSASVGATYGAIAAPTSGMIIEGNVGVGTNSPSNPLHVYKTTSGTNDVEGVMAIERASSGTAAAGLGAVTQFYLEDDAGSQRGAGQFGVRWEDAAVANPKGRFVWLENGGGELMTILDSGNVGIGTTTPWKKLAVTGTVGFDGLTAGAGAGSLCLSSTNEVQYSAGAGCTVSSERFKFNIATSSAGLAEVLAMRSVTFEYNPEIGIAGEQIGFIAEEIEKIDPRLIVRDAEGKPRTVKYEQFTAVLARAIQEQQAQIDALIASSTDESTEEESVSESLIAGILEALKKFGVEIAEGLVKMKNLAVGQFTVGTKEKPSGITIYDEDTGEPYCIKIKSGQMVSTAGECPSTDSTSSPQAGSRSSPSDEARPSESRTGQASDTEAPVITVNGNNPARISVGTSYNDLGATVTDNKDENLGIKASVDGGEFREVSDISIDTSAAGTHAIVFKATDQAGNTGTAERTIIVGDGGAAIAEEISVPDVSEPAQASEPTPSTEAAASAPASPEVIASQTETP